MRVFVAGASGAIGTRLVPQLTERRLEVLATRRWPGGAERLAEPLHLDRLDRDAVMAAVVVRRRQRALRAQRGDGDALGRQRA